MKSLMFQAIENPKPQAILVTCVDLRFWHGFHELPHALGLKEGGFMHLQLAGGPLPLAFPAEIPEEYGCLSHQLVCLCKLFAIPRVVIVTHDDCKFRAEYSRLPQGEAKEKKDLPKAWRHAHMLLPNQQTEGYHAAFTDEGKTQGRIDQLDVATWQEHHLPAKTEAAHH